MAAALSEDWQGKKSLVECNRYMFENNIADITFKLTYSLKGESSPPVHIRALKTLLLARSSVFYAMFCGELQEQCQLIEVTDVEPGAFTELIKYMYTDEVHLTADNVLAVLYASKKYMVSGLVDLCAKYLEESLTPETAPTLLDQSIFFEMNDLIPKCMEKIQSDTSIVLASEAFTNLSPEAFHEVLKSETMNAPELQVFTASIKWAENQCKIQRKKSTAANIRTTLGENLFLIRFPTMTIDEFNDDVCPKEILTGDEGFQVLRYITAKTKPKNLPFITRNRNPLKMESAAAIVSEKRCISMNSPFQKIHVNNGDFLHSKLQCVTSHSIQIHQVIVHAPDFGWNHVLSVCIQQGGQTLQQTQGMHVTATTSQTYQHRHVTAEMQNVVVSKGQFEIEINRHVSLRCYMQVCTKVSRMSDEDVTIDINSLTGHNILLGFEYSLMK